MLNQSYHLSSLYILMLSHSHMCTHTDEGLRNISSQFAIGFGSFVDKIAYPFASTHQNGSGYMTFHLARMRYNVQYVYIMYIHTCRAGMNEIG